MRRLFILALMIGAMADQRAPQGVNPTGTGSPVHAPATYRTLLTLPVGDTVPILLIADSGRWVPPSTQAPATETQDTLIGGMRPIPIFIPGNTLTLIRCRRALAWRCP